MVNTCVLYSNLYMQTKIFYIYMRILSRRFAGLTSPPPSVIIHVKSFIQQCVEGEIGTARRPQREPPQAENGLTASLPAITTPECGIKKGSALLPNPPPRQRYRPKERYFIPGGIKYNSGGTVEPDIRSFTPSGVELFCFFKEYSVKRRWIL